MKKKLLEPRWYQTWIGETAACGGIGLLVTLIRGLFDQPTSDDPKTWEMMWTFLGTTGLLMIVAVRKRVAEFEIQVRERNDELAAAGDIDNLLLQLQARMREVQTNRSAVFKTYCKQELEAFLGRVSRAAQQGELIVNEHHFLTIDDVLEAFAEQKDRVYRGVWKVEEGERLFDTAWQHYMKKLIELTEARPRRRRVLIELLIVLDKEETLHRRALAIVVGYLRAKRDKGIHYRLITEETYNELVRDSQLSTLYEDFGVYGGSLLYRTETYEPKQGMFSEDEPTTRLYRQMHETAMRSAKALPDPPTTASVFG